MGSNRSSKPAKRPRARIGAVALAAAALPSEERHRMIALAAYFRAERRGFNPGQELDDWFEAEAKIDATLGLRQARQ
jgi:hypothetical protein